MQHSGRIGQFIFKMNLMVENHSKNLVRAIGKVLLMKFN